MRPLTLVLAAVMAVAGAYTLLFWRNTSDVRQQIEEEQAARIPEARQYDDVRRSMPGGYQAQSYGTTSSTPRGRPAGEPGMPAPADIDDDDEPAEEESLPGSEMMPTPQAADSAALEPDQSGEDKQRNYEALERTANRIGADIQRHMRRGEILRHGRGVGVAVLQYMGYTVNGGGEHETPDGSFAVDVKGPDLIVVTGTSGAFDNELEMTIIGPRDVDRRLRRVR